MGCGVTKASTVVVAGPAPPSGFCPVNSIKSASTISSMAVCGPISPRPDPASTVLDGETGSLRSQSGAPDTACIPTQADPPQLSTSYASSDLPEIHERTVMENTGSVLYTEEPYLVSLAEKGSGVYIADVSAAHARPRLSGNGQSKSQDFDVRKNNRKKSQNGLEGDYDKDRETSLAERKLEYLFNELYREEQRERHIAAKHRCGHRTWHTDRQTSLPVDFLNSDYDVGDTPLNMHDSFDFLAQGFDFPGNQDDIRTESPGSTGSASPRPNSLNVVQKWTLQEGQKEHDMLSLQRQLEDSLNDSLSRKASLRDIFEPQSQCLGKTLAPWREDGSEPGSQ